MCFGRHFGFVIYGHVKRSRSWSRAVILVPLPSSLCAFYGHQNSGAAAFDMRLRCGPRKSFHFNFFIFFFAFHFSVFGFFFSHFFLSHSLCCPIGNCQTGREVAKGMRGSRSEPNATPKTNLNFRKSSCKFTRQETERGRQREARVANIGFGLKQPDQRNL